MLLQQCKLSKKSKNPVHLVKIAGTNHRKFRARPTSHLATINCRFYYSEILLGAMNF